MPTADADGLSLFYETDGRGRTVVFVGEAGVGAWQWGHEFEGVAGPREALVWDLPGTGRSDSPAGSLDVDGLAAALEAVLSAAGADRAHLVGAGLGGMVALRYARDYGRARSLALLGTTASGTGVDEAALRALFPGGDEPAALRSSLAGAFSRDFRESDVVDRIVEWRQAEDAEGPALSAQVDAMLGFEAGPLHEIGVPAIVFHGVDDPVVPPECGESIADELPRGEYVPVEGRHLAHFEAGPAVTDRLLSFLESVE